MNRERALDLLRRVAAGELAADAAADALAVSPLEDLGFATIDHHRAVRLGFPEVILAAGKTTEQVVEIADRIAARRDGFLVTRADANVRRALAERIPTVELNDLGRTVYLQPDKEVPQGTGTVLVVTAGTSDLPVAEEAAVTLRALGNCVERLTDVGVAGIHRLLSRSDVLTRAAVVIVVAGMEGALPSVVGGIVRVPVIAVPTSVGYGASFGGITALLAMLNSCATGVSVVNIDNGFGAAAIASSINHLD